MGQSRCSRLIRAINIANIFDHLVMVRWCSGYHSCLTQNKHLCSQAVAGSIPARTSFLHFSDVQINTFIRHDIAQSLKWLNSTRQLVENVHMEIRGKAPIFVALHVPGVFAAAWRARLQYLLCGSDDHDEEGPTCS